MKEREGRVVVRGLGWSGAGYPLNVGLAFAAQVLAAQLLDPGDFGTYSLALSLFLSIALIAQLGLPQSLIRRASAAFSRGDDGTARREIVSALVVATLVALVAGALVGSPLGSELLSEGFPRTAVASVAALVGAKAALRILENVVPEAIRAFRDFARATVFNGLLTNLVFCAVLVGMLVADTRPSLEVLLLASVLVSAATLVPAVASLVEKLRHLEWAGPRLRNPVDPAVWLSTVGLAVIGQLDLLVVGALGTRKEVALYAAPFRLALLVGLPLVVVNQVMPPLIAGWHVHGARDRLERGLRSTAGVAFATAIALTVVLVVAGRPLLGSVFGDFYEDGWAVLAILTAGQALQTWTGSCGFTLLMTGHQRAYAWLVGVSMPVTAALDVVLYDVMGIDGVAVATAVSLIAQNVVQVVLVRRLVGVSTIASLPAAIGEARGWLAERRPR